MATKTQQPGTLPESSGTERLDSWKEIAAYLKRDERTVRRWEQEGMPVHRHMHKKQASVYAHKAEIDVWWKSGRQRLESPEPPPASKRPRLWLWAALSTAGVLALLAFTTTGLRERLSKKFAAANIHSLAVLPLKNLSGDPAQDYLADGMTEELIGRLAGIRNLRVISRTSVMRFKDTQLLVPEIAKTLGVDAVVEGSVMREGNQIRVHAQLIRAATDEHFWSESYDRDLGDALALESEVAQSIARRVEVTVTGEERARLVAARHVSPEVYESYLKGEFTQGFKRADIEKKIAYFEEAISKDSMFAPAYLRLAEASEDLGSSFVGGSPDEVRPKVISAARKALELDPQLAEAHALLADLQQDQWQWAEAEAEYRQALDLKPNDAAAHVGLANWLVCQGRIDEALTWAQRARELDPLGVTGVQTGFILLFARRYDEAIRELRSVLAVHPDYDLALWALGSALIDKGQYEDAIPVLEKTVTMTERSPITIDSLATAYGYAGRRTDALRLIRELKQRRQTSYVSAGVLIGPYVALGDYDEAFVWLERAYQEKSETLQYLKVDPFLDPVRSDPRFVDLIRRVGLD